MIVSFKTDSDFLVCHKKSPLLFVLLVSARQVVTAHLSGCISQYETPIWSIASPLLIVQWPCRPVSWTGHRSSEKPARLCGGNLPYQHSMSQRLDYILSGTFLQAFFCIFSLNFNEYLKCFTYIIIYFHYKYTF